MEYDEFEKEEEQGITLSQILAVLFGRKITFFSVWAGVFVLGVLALKFVVEPQTKIYTTEFEYTTTVADTETFSDGQDINIYELVSLENIIGVANEVGISESNAKNIYYSSKFVVRRNEETEVVEQVKLSHVYFSIELPTKPFKNATQVRNFMQGIADLPNLGEQFILSTQVNDKAFALYEAGTTFDLQVSCLESQVELLKKRYKALLETYGDVFINNGNKISDAMSSIEDYFKINSLDEINDQIRVNGYVKGAGSEKDKYQAQIDTLTREKNVAQLKLNDLKTQRDDLLTTAAGTVQSLELTEYNTQIIELTLRLRDIDEEVEILQKKIDNLDKISTDADLQASIAQVQTLLDSYKDQLVEFTDEYEEAATYVAENNSLTYFKSSSVVNVENSVGLIKLFAYPLIVGLLLALVVNLFIDGKKLTKRFRLVPVYMIKNEYMEEPNEEKEENDENKTA